MGRNKTEKKELYVALFLPHFAVMQSTSISIGYLDLHFLIFFIHRTGVIHQTQRMCSASLVTCNLCVQNYETDPNVGLS